MSKLLAPKDYAAAAAFLGTDVATIMTVAAVESAGAGFLADGRPKILFEAHVFSRLTERKYDASHPNISSPRWNKALYRGGAAEHERLEMALVLDRSAALQSASWGKFQVMGFNFKRCGFATVQKFVNAMFLSEAEHLNAFCSFVKSMSLDDELQRHDWAAFANGYNGSGYAANHYDTRLELAYARFQAFGVSAETRLV